jgi:hypothetical protein
MNNKFRFWLRDLWLQNCDEHREHEEMLLTQEQYFKMYKYWLKREFKHQHPKPDSNFAVGVVLDDKLNYTGPTLLSQTQSKTIKLQKENNEK